MNSKHSGHPEPVGRAVRPRRLRERPTRHVLAAVMVALTVGGLAACAPEAPAASSAPPTSEAPMPTTTVTTLRALIDAEPEHPPLTEVGAAAPLAGEQAVSVTYPSGGVTVAGVLRTPAGATDGTAPVAVVVHGAVDPTGYSTGVDLEAEQRALLDAGYVVFALDLRGYGASDPSDVASSPVIDPGFGWDIVLDWGMALDVVNALRIAADGELPGGDPDRIGLVGHSLGGLLAIDAAVIAPEIPRIVVALAPAPTDFATVLHEQASLQDAETGEPTLPADLPPADDPYWADVSPATFFDRAAAPLLVIHGADDEVIPPAWSTATTDAWRAAGQPAELIVVPGADHALSPGRDQVAATVVAAMQAVLGPAR